MDYEECAREFANLAKTFARLHRMETGIVSVGIEFDGKPHVLVRWDAFCNIAHSIGLMPLMGYYFEGSREYHFSANGVKFISLHEEKEE